MLRKKQKSSTDHEQRLPSNQVFSYRSYRSGSYRNTGRRQSTVQSPESPRRGYKAFVKKILPICLFAIIAGTLLSILFLGGDPRVRLVQANGGVQRVEEAAYQDGITNIWRDDINNLTKLTVNTEKTSQAIASEFPEIGMVTIELPLLGRRPLIVITTVPAVATISNPTGSYYLSDDGKLIGEVNASYGYTGSTELLAITDNSGLQTYIGEYVLNTDQVGAIRALVQGLEESEAEVDEVILPAVANQVDIRLENESYYLKFSLLEDPRQGVGSYLAARDTFNRAGKPTEYVDVRVPEKIYYK